MDKKSIIAEIIKHHKKTNPRHKYKHPKQRINPIAYQKQYETLVKSIFNKFKDITDKKVYSIISSWKGRGIIDEDDPEADLEDLEDDFDNEQNKIFNIDEDKLKMMLMVFGLSLAVFNKTQFEKIFEKAVGIPYPIGGISEDAILKSWIFGNVKLIKNLTNDYRKNIENTLFYGYKNNESASTLTEKISQIDETFEGYRSELIARDQTAKLNGDYTKARQQDAGINTYIWRTMEDERVRGDPSGKFPDPQEGDNHYLMDGKYCSWDDDTVYADTLEDALADNWTQRTSEMAEGQPGSAINCFLGQTEVRSYVPIQKIYRRNYVGELIQFIFGKTDFTCTPNHPILRADGVMVAAQNLNIGDNIFNICSKAIDISKNNNKNGISTFKQTFDFFANFYEPIKRKTFIEDFHGDGIPDQDIDIIDMECKLGDSFKSILKQFDIEKFFSIANQMLSFLSGSSISFTTMYCSGFSSFNFICFFTKLLLFFEGHILESDKISLRTISNLNSIFNEPISNGLTGNIIFFGKAKNTFTFEILRDKFFFRKMLSIASLSIMMNNRNAFFPEIKRKITAINSHDFSNFIDIFPRKHKFLRIDKKIICENSSVHIYNLQNDLSWYSITKKNIIVKNCRCYAEAVFESIDNESENNQAGEE